MTLDVVEETLKVLFRCVELNANVECPLEVGITVISLAIASTWSAGGISHEERRTTVCPSRERHEVLMTAHRNFLPIHSLTYFHPVLTVDLLDKLEHPVHGLAVTVLGRGSQHSDR
jgi:hypothetical protein